jgi:hypothetical protein
MPFDCHVVVASDSVPIRFKGVDARHKGIRVPGMRF